MSTTDPNVPWTTDEIAGHVRQLYTDDPAGHDALRFTVEEGPHR